MLKNIQGWAACPFDLYNHNRCLNDTNWTTAPMSKKVLLTAYRQRAATLYSSQSFTILDSQMIGDPEIQPLRASEYKAIWSKIFIADSLSSVDDQTMIASLTWALGWLMRLYDDDYPDDNATPLTHLQNFLAIPIQFTIACIIYANSTLNLTT